MWKRASVLHVSLVVLLIGVALREPNAATIRPSNPIGAAEAQQPQAAGKITGTAVDSGGQPLAVTGLLLIRVRLYTLNGEEVTKLPSKDTVLIFAQDDPPLEAKTDSAGSFTFNGVPPALYAIKLKGSKDTLFERASGDVALQVSGKQTIDVAKVHPQDKRRP